MEKGKVRDIKKFIIVLLILILIIGIIVGIVGITSLIKIKGFKEKYAEEIAYLSTKYGKDTFEVIGEGEETAPSGQLFGSRQVLYTYAKVKEKDSGVTFAINKENNGVYSESFLQQYYKNIIDKYLEKDNAEIIMQIAELKIPDDCGFVPTLTELNKYGAIYSINIISNNDFTNANSNDELNYLKKLSYNLATCLFKDLKEKDLSLDIKCQASIYEEGNFGFPSRKDLYSIKIMNNILSIIDKKGQELATLDISKLE